MSIYFEQFAHQTDFKTSENWVVLSPIEKQIKEKIEAIGTPLKEWDININYGIKTGFNEAFIITGKRRKELIDEDPKSDEIIRPILRGRDIKRYSYDFADLWIINTHNGIKEKGLKRIEIGDYPAIKNHLEQFLPQLKKRADKGGTPYNLRNCAYMEDFYKQKMVWKRVGSILRFSYDETGALALDSTCFATGHHIKYLVTVLNSRFGKYLMKDSPKTGTGDLLISVQAIEPLQIAIPTKEGLVEIEMLFENIFSTNQIELILQLESRINSIIYRLYDFNQEEIQFIELQ